MKFRCKSCQAVISAREEHAGKLVACPSCQTKLRVPNPPGAPATPAPVAAGQPPRSQAKMPRPSDKPSDPRQRPSAKKMTPMVIWASVAGGSVALLLFIAGGVWMLSPSPQKTRTTVAQADPAKKPATKTPAKRIDPPVQRPVDPVRPDPPKVDPEPEPKPEPKPERRPEPKPEPKPAPKPEPPPDPKEKPLVTVEPIATDFKVPVADDAAQEARERSMLEFHRRSTVEAYDKVGKKDSAWDAAAREALGGVAKADVVGGEAYMALHPLFKKAVDAGCDDPLILYYNARASILVNHAKGVNPFDPVIEAGLKLADSKYPALRRAGGLQSAATFLANKVKSAGGPEAQAEKVREIEKILDTTLTLITQAHKDAGPKDRTDPAMKLPFYDIIDRVAEMHKRLGRSTPESLERISSVLKDSPEMEPYVLAVHGQRGIDYAWEARGFGVNTSVTPEGWQKFGERLSESAGYLQKSWDAEPSSVPAASMITVIKGTMRRKESRAPAKEWFDRAMKENPNDSRVIQQMLDYLDPRWLGSSGEVVGFGQVCRDSKNWQAGITLAVAEAHYRAVAVGSPAIIKGYMSSPPVWKDIEGVYTEYFKHRPDDQIEHFRFAVWCAVCDRPDLSREHFGLAPQTITATMFVPREEVARIQKLMRK